MSIEPHASRAGQQGREFVDTMIDVKEHDLDLSLIVRPGASFTGRVVAEPSGAITTPIGLRVTVNKAHEQLAAEMPIAAAMNGDWSFKITGLSGSYTFFVSSDRHSLRGGGGGYREASVMSGEVDNRQQPVGGPASATRSSSSGGESRLTND